MATKRKQAELTIDDLTKRWKCSRRWVQKLKHDSSNFPLPVLGPIMHPLRWTVESIKAYEKSKGWA